MPSSAPCSDDFTELIITSYIETAAIEYLKMDSLTDNPSQEFIQSPSETLPLEERKALLMKICGDIIESFISLNILHKNERNGGTSFQNLLFA